MWESWGQKNQIHDKQSMAVNKKEQTKQIKTHTDRFRANV